MAPQWIPNRSMGFVMTITVCSSTSTFDAKRPRRLEFGSPEFVQKDEWFVLQPADLP